MKKKFRFDEWLEKYHNKEFINLINYFRINDIKILKKLGIKVKSKIYTEYDFDIFKEELIRYYKDDTMDDEDLAIVLPLEGKGVTREEYNELYNKFEKIEKEYNNKRSKIYF